MIDATPKHKLKLALSEYEKDCLDCITSSLSRKLGVEVSMSWVIRTMVLLSGGDRTEESEPGCVKFTIGELALLEYMMHEAITAGLVSEKE